MKGPIYFTQSTNSNINLNLKLPSKMPKTVFDNAFGLHDPPKLTHGINYHNSSQAAETDFVLVGEVRNSSVSRTGSFCRRI